MESDTHRCDFLVCILQQVTWLLFSLDFLICEMEIMLSLWGCVSRNKNILEEAGVFNTNI